MKKGILVLIWLCCATCALAQESAIELINAADRLYQADGPSMAAVDAYSAVYQKFGGSDHAARAHYMAGECLYLLEEPDLALGEFAQVKGANGRTDVLAACAELRQGQCLFSRKDFVEASKHFEKVMKSYKDTYLYRDAGFAYAQTMVALGEWEEFKKTADEIVAKWAAYGELPQLRFAYGIYHYQRNEHEEAKAFFRQVESERARYYLAHCLFEDGQFLMAIQQYRQLLVRYPTTMLAADVRFAIAESFLRSGQHSLAQSAFQDLLLSHPNSHHAQAAHFKLASILYQEKDYIRTLDSLDKLVLDIAADDPLLEKILMLKGLSFFALGRESEADHAFSSILQAFPDGRTGSTALFKMMHHYARNENWNQSIGMAHMFQDRFTGDPLEGRVQLIQALNNLKLDDIDTARDILGKLLDKHADTDLGEKALFLLTWSYHLESDLSRIVTNYRHLSRRLLPTPNIWRGRTYYLIAESYFELGLYQDAADLYRLVLGDYPFSDVAPFALQGMTASYSHLGDDQRALLEQERYLLVISNDAGSNPANALAAAGMYFNREEFKRALELFEQFLSASPDSPERPAALYQSGECLYALQYYEDAVSRWRQVLHSHPDYEETPEVLRKLGDTLFGLQMYGEAHSHYANLANRFPDHEYAEEALFNCASCIYNQQDYDAAVTAFEAYSSLYPDGMRQVDAQQAIQACYLRSGKDMLSYIEANPDAVFAAEVLWEKGGEAFRANNFEEAAQHYEAITIRYSDSEIAPEALYYLAEALYALGRHESALAAFENFTATYPDRELVPTALLKAGNILFIQDNFAAAAGHFLILADQYSANELASLGMFNAGLCYRKLEQWQSFLLNAGEFLERYPDDERRLETQLQMAEVFQTETGQYEEALVIFDRVAALTGAPACRIHYQRGECLHKLGREDESRAAYQQSAEQPGGLDNDFGIAALARLATLHEEEGNLSEARICYQRIAENSNNTEWAALAREQMDVLDQELQQARVDN
ncbi:MAG: tetratricopeptide repeat protein [bacterium]|nr:tetratricopeptide repeat protein [bacterium]